MKRNEFLAVLLTLWLSTMTMGVTSVINRHRTGTDFIKGETENVIVDSAGTLTLARQSIELDCGDLLDDVWSIHTIIADDQGAFYLGTGPDAKVIRYADQRAEQIYPLQESEPNDLADTSIDNEHVFALAQDMAGRLLIGISGETGKLIRLDSEPQTVFQDERVKYIFSIALDQNKNVYLGTGPEGLVFRLDPFCNNSEVIYDAKDKSILSLMIRDGVVYAGSDERGLIYKIDPNQKRASVLYDSRQDEVPALWIDEQGDVYAAATSAQAAMLQMQAKTELSIKKAPGRPDSDSDQEPSTSAETINTANNDESKEKEEKPESPKPMPPAAKVAGHIYNITPEGFVTDIFGEMAVFYSLVYADGKLWLGTGNKGQVFSVDPQTEEKSIVFEDKTSSQVTAAVESDGALYLGLSNPAKFVKLRPQLEPKGVFESPLIDAGQPARWGKLQIEADIPEDCRIQVDCRSGNVKDPNDSTFSDWSPQTVITQATNINCPVARFCQYRLTLTTDTAHTSPIIRQVTTAHVIPNLAPKVREIKVQRSRDSKKPRAMEIAFKAEDENKDSLEYKLEFRQSGRNVWILLKDELDQSRYLWDGRTVEDGHYEVRVIANDRKSNTPETTLTGSRISDVFVIDNTAPEISELELNVEPAGLRADFTVVDALSVLGKVRYTVNSNEKWITALPDDLVYDTLSETFTIQIDDLEPGQYVIAFSVEDDLDNTRYQTYEVTIP